MTRKLRTMLAGIETAAVAWNKQNGVEWPYGYGAHQDARARQIAGWNGRKRTDCEDIRRDRHT